MNNEGRHCIYQSVLFDEKLRRKSLSAAVRKLRKVDFDTIAVIGVSGIFGAMLAHRMRKRLVVVRKNDGSHSSYSVENLVSGKHHKILIVDDLVATGNTVRSMLRTILKEISMWSCRPTIEFAGIYVYGHDQKSGEFKTPDRFQETFPFQFDLA